MNTKILVCPKCASINHYYQWGFWRKTAPGRYVQLSIFGSKPDGDEAIRVTCANCGFEWLEPPLMLEDLP